MKAALPYPIPLLESCRACRILRIAVVSSPAQIQARSSTSSSQHPSRWSTQEIAPRILSLPHHNTRPHPDNDLPPQLSETASGRCVEPSTLIVSFDYIPRAFSPALTSQSPLHHCIITMAAQTDAVNSDNLVIPVSTRLLISNKRIHLTPHHSS